MLRVMSDVSAAVTIIEPQPFAHVYDEAIRIVGNIAANEVPRELSVWRDDERLGITRFFSPREGSSQFQLLARFSQPLQSEKNVELTVEADFASGMRASAELPITVVPAQLSNRPYGEVLRPDCLEVLHRENIYGSGPPIEEPSGEVVRLLQDFLPPRASVLDIGCGAGAYGPPLIAAGHDWLGAEVQPLCHEILARRGLPFHKLNAADSRLPFRDGEFDAAIAIEVLEHIESLAPFVAGLARVTRSRVLVSVPNMEIIPCFAPLGVVPWHLLEATHVNFFTRASLRAALAPHFAHVEVFTFGPHPVQTPDAIPVHLHLFAVAER